MKKIILALCLLLAPSAAFAQCTGVFPASTVCGVSGAGANVPGPLPLSSFALAPGGVSGNVQFNNGSGGLGGYTNTQLTALINAFTSVLSGAVPASGGGTVNFLRADGSWAPVVQTIAGNSGAFTLNATTGITNATNDIQLEQASASQFGAVKVDNTTIGAAAGVISTKNIPVLLNTLTASGSATLSDLTSLTATYSSYELVIQNLISAANNVDIVLQVHAGGNFQTTTYLTKAITPNGTAILNNNPTTFIPLGDGATDTFNSAPGISGTIRVFSPSTSALHMWVGYFNFLTSAGSSGPAQVTGYYNSAVVVDGFQIKASTGNLTSGTVRIYGYP